MAKKPTLDGPLGHATDGVSGPGEKAKDAREARIGIPRAGRTERPAEIFARLEQERSAAAEKAKAEAEAQPQVYVVQAGDTLSKIAGKLLGDPKRWKEIFEANQDQIKNPDLILVGWELRIPKES